MRYATFLLSTALWALSAGAAAPAPAPAARPDRAAAFDQAYFQAFNTCDLKTLSALTAPDLEFFHDLNGMQRGREAFLASVEKNVCGKFRREPVAGTMESWPLGQEGVIYAGTHRFCAMTPSAQTAGCQGSGRYLHVLVEHDGKLRLSRVVSYDHRALN
ncbi:MAG: nuclear transport factor 2 family protein [Betaproteobacteria bacterium]|nr:nuclear transport factor 2 family protein [Betaproteobacteria bacterium]